ncbi:hypothetical protein [Legionella norrlandica]|uniref:hypothetical protein n=1 Tax=Legionella norrlandica TaxID=1498499 RepID=UPI000B140289|nr:hypothetical protein [Legionella norrlandica]
MISLWDIENEVFSEAKEIYDQFVPCLIVDKIDDLVSVYKEVMNKHIIPYQNRKSVCRWFTHYDSTLEWCRLVESGDLPKIDVYWFEPELLLHILLQFKTSDKLLNEQIIGFLDELIHTYAQNNDELLIQLRVNILFTELLKNFDEQQKRNLILTLQIDDPVNAKKEFLDNCITYVTSRLRYIGMPQSESSTRFFGSYQEVDCKKFLIGRENSRKVENILETFKEIVYSIKSDQKENMLTYLRRISRPILTILEKEEAQQCSKALDFLGTTS